MNVRPKDIEVGALVVWTIAFIAVERAWPGKLAVDRKRDILRDLLALVVVSVGAGGSRALLLAIGKGLGIGDFLGMHALLTLPWPIKILIAIVLIDFAIYFVHRAMHAFDLLWATHRFHHSTEHLYWLSGLRTSALHAFLYAVPQTFVSFWLLGFGPAELAAAAVIGLFFQFYIHSSVDFGLGPLSWLIVTPRMHRLHHTRGPLQSKNLGTFFTIWDRMFGTYVDPDSVPAPEQLGVDEPAEKTRLARMIVGV